MTLDEYLKNNRIGQREFSEKLGVSQAMVSKMVLSEVPAERVMAVAEATQWECTPHELRPDIYPHPDDGLPAEMRCKCEKDAA